MIETDVIAINRQGIVQLFQVKKEYSKYCHDIPGSYFKDNVSDSEKISMPFLSFDGVLEQLPINMRKEVRFDYEGKQEIEKLIEDLKSANQDPEEYTKIKNKLFKKIKYYELNESWTNKILLDISDTSLIKVEPEKVKAELEFSKVAKIKNTEPLQEEGPKKTSLFIDENYMYEQIKKDSKNSFIKYYFNENKWEETESIDGNEPLYPIDDEEVMAGHIKLSSGVEEYGTEEQLIEQIEKHVKKYLHVPDDYLHYASLNILKSWVYERYRSLNYLRVQGEPGTGKSRFLDVIGQLHYKPIATSGASTVAPIFRLINKWGCTLIMDEADLRESDETNDLIKIINQGFEKDRPVIRCNPDDKSKVEFFKVYCPKVLSTRHAFDDPATESRCMTQIMTGTTRKDIISSLDDDFYNEQQSLRNKLLLWRFRNYQHILPNIGETLNWEGIELRLKQTNVGFISLIFKDKPYVEKFMERIRNQQKELRNERSETYEGHIVSACVKIVLEDKPILARTIIDYAELTDQKGNKWKPRKIASFMKTLGFLGTRLVRIDGIPEKVYEYNNETLWTLCQKYLTEDELKDFIEQCHKKVSALTTFNHMGLFCNYVTNVTDIYEQGKEKKLSEVGTSNHTPLPATKQGYIGYTVTERLDKMVLNGDLVRNANGTLKEVYK